MRNFCNSKLDPCPNPDPKTMVEPLEYEFKKENSNPAAIVNLNLSEVDIHKFGSMLFSLMFKSLGI